MRKRIFISRSRISLGSLLLVLAVSSFAWGDDRFSLAIGAQGSLDILGSNGQTAAELKVPAISQPVTVNGTTFQVSYGRDANGLLTAILTPMASAPQELHFNVLGKTIDTDKKAVVTLTFSSGLTHVTIDPGYVGVVQVNSQSLKHHHLRADTYAPHPYSPQPTPHPSPTASVTIRLTPPADASTPASSAPSVTSDRVPNNISSTPSPAPAASTTQADPPPMASLSLATPIASTLTPLAAIPTTSTTHQATMARSGNSAPSPPPLKLFWAEPITPLHGPPLVVGSNEMKLTQVHGTVMISSRDGDKVAAVDGAILPSGSTIATSAGSSVAVFMGGINSVRFLPNSQGTINQKMDGSTRVTSISLHRGTIFNRVGRRAGEIQDYKVHTPQGVAAARGTEFAVTIADDGNGNQFTVCYTQQGIVELKSNDGTQDYILTPKNIQQIAVGAIPKVSVDVEKALLIATLSILQQFNTQLNAIGQALATNPDSVPQADKDYYNSNSDLVDGTTQFYDAVNSDLSTLFGVSTTSSTPVDTGDGTTTTTTTTTNGNQTVTTAITTNDATGEIEQTVTTVKTAYDNGVTTTSTATTNSDGTTTTSNNNSGSDFLQPPENMNPLPATGTLNTDLNPFKTLPVTAF